MTRQQWQDKVLLFLFAAGERAGACKGSVVWSLEQPLQLCGQQRQSFEALSFDSLIELKSRSLSGCRPCAGRSARPPSVRLLLDASDKPAADIGVAAIKKRAHDHFSEASLGLRSLAWVVLRSPLRRGERYVAMATDLGIRPSYFSGSSICHQFRKVLDFVLDEIECRHLI